MNRRTFFKSLAVSAVALHQAHQGITADGKDLQPHKDSGFCEFCEYGNSMPLVKAWNQCDKKYILDILHKEARKVLPKGTYYEIRMRIPNLRTDVYRVIRGIAWYRSPYMTQRIGELAQPKLAKDGGYVFVGGYLA